MRYLKVTEQDRLVIAAQDNETLVKWANMINRWEWPTELAGHPDGKWLYRHGKFKLFGIWFFHKSIREWRESQIRHYIENIVGEKACLRAHNSHMSDDEFDFWWTRPWEEYYEKYCKDTP